MWVEINHACRTIHITNKENALHKTIIAKSLSEQNIKCRFSKWTDGLLYRLKVAIFRDLNQSELQMHSLVRSPALRLNPKKSRRFVPVTITAQCSQIIVVM
jgi:hypothetical protein